MSSIDKINLIRPSSLSGIKRVAAVIPAVSDHNRQKIADGGNNMPQTGSSGYISEAMRKEISRAAKDVSGYIQNISRELNFSVDEELDKTVITVIDEETGNVIRQIPSEEILSIAKNIAQIRDADSKGMLFHGDA